MEISVEYQHNTISSYLSVLMTSIDMDITGVCLASWLVKDLTFNICYYIMQCLCVGAEGAMHGAGASPAVQAQAGTVSSAVGE